MKLLTGVPQNYAWGSDTAIHKALGTRPTGRPLAEFWLGAHPNGPAVIRETQQALGAFISQNPVATLGKAVHARFGATLPYLLKLIAPARSLSLQVHPNIARARSGYLAEDTAKVPLDAAHRVYRDKNHKPELLLALTNFETLSGFRPAQEAAELLATLRTPLTDKLSTHLGNDATSVGKRQALALLLDARSTPPSDHIATAVQACAERLSTGSPSPEADHIVLKLALEHPDDPAVLAPLLLNSVTLKPGEAHFIPPGHIHSYTRGLGIEVMASSDNVIRAGLTEKHSDTKAFIEILADAPSEPTDPNIYELDNATKVIRAPVEEFELSLIALSPERLRQQLYSHGPRTLLCLDGRIEISSSTASLRLTQGDAAFVMADAGPLTARGAGSLIQVGMP